jgi:hypothetical protein
MEVSVQDGVDQGWIAALEKAATLQAVIALSNEFLARLSPDDLVLLPARCAPRLLMTAGDVGGYAYDLLAERTLPDSQANVVLSAISAVICRAARRLAELTILATPARTSQFDAWAPLFTRNR